ncbi:MAG: protein kinase domain-containing protein [Planctomycetota bacterium]|jgi:serine/threonine-protein kinase
MEEKRDVWEGGMRAAFSAGDGRKTGESVLESIERLSGTRARLLLHDDESDSAPVVRVGGDVPADDSRYQVVGEIARGGVGVIYKARDKDLGRDIALKVLRDVHAERADVLERFIEEAQIGGQLQHPGIVPVYGMGLQPDGRPFFAMKLIKGRTLGSRLKERGDPSEDRRRFLQIFEQACQTLAYVHARGVIHRDLKPANILVGGFGEVQVIDWGFGKVLGRAEPARSEDDVRTRIATVRSGSEGTDSIVGSVMGTPAYMPPEQALGHIDELDEQTDVFALGAILCEILTGKPPYTGSGKDLLVLASQARLEPAYERLDACGADAEIVALAKRALAPLREERLADAQEFASEMSAYLTAAEERARQAEVDAVTERGRLEDERARTRFERRAKRRVRVLAGVFVGAILLGGGAWFWQNAREQARIADAREPFEDSLQQATLLAGRKLWDEALTVAHRAAAAAADGDMAERASGLIAAVERDKRLADESRLQAQRDAALLRALEDIRLIWFEDDKPKYDREFARAFEEHGLDPTSPDAANRLRGRGEAFCAEVVAALDDWIWLRKEFLARDDWTQLRAFADAATVREGYRRLREPIIARDREALRRIAGRESHEELGHRGQFALANALWSVGEPDLAVDLLRRWREERPDDFWVHCLLGRIQEVRAPQESIDAYTVAAALRPEHRELLHRLGIVLHQQNNADGALAVWEKGLALDPDDGHLRSHVVEILLERGEVDRAFAEAQRSVTRNADDRARGMYGEVLARRMRERAAGMPDSAGACENLAQAHIAAGRATDALAAAREAIRIAPLSARAHHLAGEAQLRRSRVGLALAAHRRAVELAPESAQYLLALGITLRQAGLADEALPVLAKARKLRPDRVAIHIERSNALTELDRYAEALESGRQVLRLSPGHWGGLNAVANSLYFLGRYEEAADAAKEGLRGLSEIPKNAYSRGRLYRLLGLSLRMQGESEKAFSAYRKAAEEGNRQARDTLVLHLLEHGRLEEAESESRHASPSFAAHCRRVLDLRERVPALSRGEFEPDTAPEWAEFGMVCAYLQRDDEAVRCYLEAFKRDPGAEFLARTREILLLRSAARASSARREEARRLLENYLRHVEEIQIERDPIGVHGILVKAAARGYLGETREAPEWRFFWTRVDALRRSAITPGTALYAIGRTRKLSRWQRWRGVIPACREAIRLKPGVEVGIRELLVQALYMRLRYHEAIAACQEARKLHPRSAQLCNLHSLCLAIVGRHEDAITACRDGLAIEPKADLHHNLAGVQFSLGDLDAALAHAEKALELRGRDAAGEFRKSKYLLARILYFRSADEALQAVREAGPFGLYRGLASRISRLASIEPHLEAILSGERTPADAREAALFGELCYARGHPEQAVAFFRRAFEDESSLKEVYARIAGVCAVRSAAALPAGEARFARLGQAREWFEADLARLRGEADEKPGEVLGELAEWPAPWIPEVVEPEALARLPAAERAAWESFHAARAALRAQIEEELR